MSIIKSHDRTLHGGNDKYKITLRPLTDEYLPYLYKQNSDPEVLYWKEGEDVESYPHEVIHQIYGGISQNNPCFVVEVNGKIIGECWLQKMNLLNVKEMYANGTDVRRIDMSIGEKVSERFVLECWLNTPLNASMQMFYIVFAKIIIFVQDAFGKRMGLHLF